MRIAFSGKGSADAAREARTFGLGARLLAEAVRLREDACGGPGPDGPADEAGRAAGGGLERRILARAEALPMAEPLAEALHRLRGTAGAALLVGMALAFAAGATSVRVALGSRPDEPVNFFWLLGSLLGVHALALAVWLLITLIAPRRGAAAGWLGGGWLGGVVVELTSRLDRLLHRGPLHTAAARAAASVLAGSPVGRWTLGAISHLLWLAFLAGCLALVLLMLGTKQYSFAWETTILSERSFVALTRTASWLPGLLGFPTPDATLVAESRWTGTGAPPIEARRAWAGLLIGSIVVYGLLPRVLALTMTLLAWRRAVARFRLDTSRVGYARLRTRLMPPTRAIGIIDADAGALADLEEGEGPPPPPPPIGAEGPVAILGLEIEPPATPWPPPLNDVDWLDLGFVDTGEDRGRVLKEVSGSVSQPRLIFVVCALPSTPDRGMGAFIRKLQQACRLPVAIVLTAGQRLRERERGTQDRSALKQRIEDWHDLAEQAGIPADRVIELDLDHVTAASRQKLDVLLARGGDRVAVQAAREDRIDRAFDLIVAHAERWPPQPGFAEQAQLQREIAALYEAGASKGAAATWQDLLRTRTPPIGALPRVDQIEAGAARMVELLPRRLRTNPRWLAAGAMAGALGCVAASALVSPVAIAALPAWAGLGAGVSAALSAVLPQRNGTAVAEPRPFDLGEAVTGAALFAILLHLQGRSEAAITRIIDQVAGDDAPPELIDTESVRMWLDALRHRLHQALATEPAT